MVEAWTFGGLGYLRVLSHDINKSIFFCFVYYVYAVLWAMNGSRFGGLEGGGWVRGSIFEALPGEVISTSYLAGDAVLDSWRIGIGKDVFSC